MFSQLKLFLEKINNNKDRLFFPFIKKFWPRLILPNYLTVLRIVLAILLTFLLFSGYKDRFWLVCIFIIAALTDLFDGLVARSLNKETKLGAFLDPIADVMLILPIIFYFLFKKHFWLLLFLLLFEAIYGFLYLYCKVNHKKAEGNIFGKAKMVIECVALGTIILYDFPNTPSNFPITLLYFVIIFSFLNILLNIKNLKRRNVKSL